MKTFYSLNDFLNSRASLRKFTITIGIFDGVHYAHKKLISTLIKKAKAKHLSTLLITFDPHPASVLKKAKKAPLLISLKHRLRLLEEMGIDYVVVLRFDRKLASMSAKDFIKKKLAKICVSEIVVGKNFFFGRDKTGSLKELAKFSNAYNYKLDIINPVKSRQEVISSTLIRSLIQKGNLKKASKLLSRPVSVLGTVIKGHKRGRIIGFPTANIDPHHEVIPPSGVYAVKIKLKGKLYNGVLNIGKRPTFSKNNYDSSDLTIEVHLLNFDKSIYGKDLEIIFVKKIRDENRFKKIAELKAQIKKDESMARHILR